MKINECEHLPKSKRIQLGSYYTPEVLVDKVHEFIRPYLSNCKGDIIIFDSAGGCGAFLTNLKGYDYRIADCDYEASKFLMNRFDSEKIFYTNSLKEVSRDKFSIPTSVFLIIIGNPPYNDTTSEFRHGEKGENICDDDLYDRDLGVSFLRSYYKLRADIVCVLHPLSYLIKQANFSRLHAFKDNYRLIKGEIFSSGIFSGTGIGKFPILVALYEKNPKGMTFDYIRNFRFNVLAGGRSFVLSNYQTTDGYINKYPPRKHDVKKSPIGLYYYSFRDFNSLKKNKSFIQETHPNGIVVTVENFYKYSYLYALKKLFSPKNSWLYGNLSPLVNLEDVERNKQLYVSYALKKDHIFNVVGQATVRNIAAYYGVDLKNPREIKEIEMIIRNRFSQLI